MITNTELRGEWVVQYTCKPGFKMDKVGKVDKVDKVPPKHPCKTMIIREYSFFFTSNWKLNEEWLAYTFFFIQAT